ncbi:MAG TPA: thiamine pyrophosphate-requiring protein [Streptosporangiaceae bacterium]|nr:thiamine pyrophosphate-requiring protein [Streptosporangiaceae bacterium]
MAEKAAADTAFGDAAAELVATLADEGAGHIFINPGTDTAPVQEALAGARKNASPHPRAVLCSHEFVALSSAMGHYFVTGTPQAVMVHVDAGTLNLGGALHNAQRNRVPAVIFAGRSPYSVSPEVPGHRDAPIHWQQEQLDQQAVVRAFGKWTIEVPRGRELGPIVRRAYQVAQSDPRGLAYVMLPREALMEPGTGGLARRLRPPRPAVPDPAALAQAAECLAGADRPVIVTDRAGARPETVAALAGLAELLGCPVIDHRDRVSFPRGHPLYAGDDTSVLREADVVLLLDCEVPWIPAQAAPPASATVLQIDIDPVKATMPTWTYPVDLAIAADTAIAVPLLAEQLRVLATPDRAGRWRARRQQVSQRLAEVRGQWQALAGSDGPAAAPDAMLAALSRALPPDAIVLEETVTNKAAMIRQVDREPGCYFGTGSPALGWAVGGAMGVKLARPAAPVFAVCGDGAFGFGVPTAALWSAQHAAAPFAAVILNNQAYRASRLPVQRLYPGGAADAEGTFPETGLAPAPSYPDLARAYGGGGRVVESPAEVAAAVEECLALQADGRCGVIDIRLPAG